MSTPHRIAFIGGHGHHYLVGALTDAGVEVEAVAAAGDGRDEPAAMRKYAKGIEEGRIAWHEDAVEMLDTFRPTVVSVGGVFAHNARWIVEAVRRGIPVVSDKPIAATWQALEEVRAAVREVGEEGAVVLTEFDFRARSECRAAAAAVTGGEIGEPVLAVAQKSYKFGDRRPGFFGRRADYGSTLLWIASHGIDACRFVTGQPMKVLGAAHGNLSRPEYKELEDHAVATFVFGNGGHAVVHADYLRPTAAEGHGDDRLRVVGSRGQVEVRGGRCRLTTTDEPERDITDLGHGESIHHALLAAVAGDTTWFSTAASLEIAALLLAARDAADAGAGGEGGMTNDE